MRHVKQLDSVFCLSDEGVLRRLLRRCPKACPERAAIAATGEGIPLPTGFLHPVSDTKGFLARLRQEKAQTAFARNKAEERKNRQQYNYSHI